MITLEFACIKKIPKKRSQTIDNEKQLGTISDFVVLFRTYYGCAMLVPLEHGGHWDKSQYQVQSM